MSKPNQSKPIGYHLNEIRKNKNINLSELLDYINVSNSSWYRYVKGETDITALQFLHTVRYLRTTFSEVAHMKVSAEKHITLHNTVSKLPDLTTYTTPLNDYYVTHNIEQLKLAVKLYQMHSTTTFNQNIPTDLKQALKEVLLNGEYGLEEINLLVLLKLKFDNVIFREAEFINIIHNLLLSIENSIDKTELLGDLSAAQQNVVYANQSLGLRFAFSALSSITSPIKAQQHVSSLFHVIELNARAKYTPNSLYNFASQKLIYIGESYLLDSPDYTQDYLTFRQAIFTLYPDNIHPLIENLNYDLLKINLFENTISPEMKKAYQQYVVDKQIY